MSGEAIKICIRVRPFNEKEIKENQKLCIDMVSALSLFKISD